MSLGIFSIRTIGIKLLEKKTNKKIDFNGKEESRKKPWRMTLQQWRKGFEKMHGKKLFVVTLFFVTSIYF